MLQVPTKALSTWEKGLILNPSLITWGDALLKLGIILYQGALVTNSAILSLGSTFLKLSISNSFESQRKNAL